MSAGRIRIAEVWDSTLDAARGRAGVIAPIALGAFFVPAVVQNGLGAFVRPSAPMLPMAATPIAVALALGVLVLTLWGQIAIVAVVSDPATTRADAVRQANRRIGPALANTAVLALGAVLVLVPFLIALVLSGATFATIGDAAGGTRMTMTAGSGGARLFASLYILGLAVFSIWLSARIMLLNAVALNERRGLGAIGRSIALTRGATARLVGVLVLYAVVLVVTMLVAQAAVAIPLRLAVSAPVALFVAALAGSLVSTVLVALFCIFTGRLYVAAAEAAGG